jgi:RNA polymerase sigma-70 factor, ECF subfamily
MAKPMIKAKETKGAVKQEPFVVASLERRIRHQEDRELVRLSQAGNEFAFEQLVRRHQQHVFDLVGSILRQTRRLEDVEDVAQQIFLKTYRSIRKFDQRAAFSTWLYRIAVNECRDHLRKQKARPLVYEADLSEEQVSRLDGIASSARPCDGPSEHIEANESLDRLLGSLSEQDRQLLLLREIQGFSIQELADILDLNVNTVKIRLFRARGRIADACRQPGLPRKAMILV